MSSMREWLRRSTSKRSFPDRSSTDSVPSCSSHLLEPEEVPIGFHSEVLPSSPAQASGHNAFWRSWSHISEGPRGPKPQELQLEYAVHRSFDHRQFVLSENEDTRMRTSVRRSRRSSHASAAPRQPPSCQKVCRDIYEAAVIDWRTSMWWYVWEVAVYAVTITVGFLAPFEAAFLTAEPPEFLVADHATYLIFFADMVFRFFLALPDPDRPSCLLRQPGIIIPTYLKGWLVIDLWSVLPYAALLFDTGAASGFIWKLGLWRMIRLPRLVVRETILRRWQIFFGFSFAALELLEYLLVVAMACHWMACLWGSLGLVPGDNWLRTLAHMKGHDYSHFENSVAQLYSVGLYLAIMTLTGVGYGDVCPVTMKEYWISCLCMALSAALWAFIIGEVCRIAASVDPHDTRFMQTMDDLNGLMKNRNMPQAMRMQMRTYLYEAREVARQRAQIPIIEQMSPMLQGQMAMQLHKGWLEKVWYLREIEGQALVNIARRLVTDFFAPSEEVPCHRTLFILRRGICLRRARVLIKGDVWGEDMVLSNRVLRDGSPVKALSYLEVVMLHYTDLVQAVKAFPEVVVQIQRVKVKLAVMRAVIMVARALKDVAFRVDINTCEIAQDLGNFVVQEVLAGNLPLDRRSPHQLMKLSNARKSSAFNTPRSQRGRRSAVLMTARSKAQRRLSIDDGNQFAVKSDLQEAYLEIQRVSLQLESLACDRRSSRVEDSVDPLMDDL